MVTQKEEGMDYFRFSDDCTTSPETPKAYSRPLIVDFAANRTSDTLEPGALLG